MRAQKLGIVPVMPIPFQDDEDIDETALRRLVDFAVSCKVKAICLPMYASEFYKLSDSERTRVVSIAADQAANRIKVIGNAAHGSSRLARSFARENVEAGAHMVSVPVPRAFPVTDEDLFDYLVPILQGVDVPVLLQDYNPGGPTVTVEFIRELLEACPNFQYLKLEEPLMAPKVKAIREATQERVGFLEGWGGLYIMELIPAGISGCMPGLALADVLAKAYELRVERKTEAFEVFGEALPQIVFSLQNFELFLYCEKRLLQARGLLSNANCRNARYTPDTLTVEYVDELNQGIIEALERMGFEATWRDP